MGNTRFLSNASLWHEVQTKAKEGGPAQAAIAYVGMHGANLLPLKRGDTLLVDMSLGTVKRGGTDPKAIRTLMRRGVQVFTRAGHSSIETTREYYLQVSQAEYERAAQPPEGS